MSKIIVICMFLFCVISIGVMKRAQNNIIKITAYNVYALDIRLEVKCDYDWRIKNFIFHKFIMVPGKENTTIYVPANLKECQIWPKIIW